MAKQIKQRKKPYTYKGWKADSEDGRFLARLFRSGELSPASMPSLIKERYPRFKVYKTASFAAGLRRLKAKLALNTRNKDDVEEEEDEEAVSLGSDDTDPPNDDDDEESLGSKGQNYFIDNQDEPTEGVSPVARAPVAAVSVRSPFSGHSVISPSIRQPGTLVDLTMAWYNWNPPYIKTTYTDFFNVEHQFVAVLLPSSVGVESAHDFHLFMTYYGPVQYLNLAVEWPETFAKGDGEIFLQFLNQTQQKTKIHKWLDKETLVESAKAKKDFESSFVMLCMAVKQEMIRMRISKGSTVVQSQTSIKMDFQVERLTDASWELIGNQRSGVRMVTVDLERATPQEDFNQAPRERLVRMIGGDDN